MWNVAPPTWSYEHVEVKSSIIAVNREIDSKSLPRLYCGRHLTALSLEQDWCLRTSPRRFHGCHRALQGPKSVCHWIRTDVLLPFGTTGCGTTPPSLLNGASAYIAEVKLWGLIRVQREAQAQFFYSYPCVHRAAPFFKLSTAKLRETGCVCCCSFVAFENPLNVFCFFYGWSWNVLHF